MCILNNFCDIISYRGIPGGTPRAVKASAVAVPAWPLLCWVHRPDIPGPTFLGQHLARGYKSLSLLGAAMHEPQANISMSPAVHEQKIMDSNILLIVSPTEAFSFSFSSFIIQASVLLF